MEYKLTEWNNSNYQIELIITPQQMEEFKKKALQHFQKSAKIPWFRPWHAPLELVQKQVSPEYIKIATLEEAINQGFKEVVKQNPDIKFIGEIYDIQPQEQKDKTIVSFKIDIYPQVKVLNENWKTYKAPPIEDEPTQQEVQQTLDNIRLQNAQYKDGNKVDTSKSIVKLSLSFLNDKWEEVEKWTAMIGPEDFEEFPTLKTLFEGQKKWATIEIDYNKDLGPLFKAKNQDVKKIKATIEDIKDRSLPELTDERVKQTFGEEVPSVEALTQKIKEVMKQEKEAQALSKAIEQFLEATKDSFEVQIPKTILESETQARLKSLAQRLGGEEWLKKYLQNMPQDQQKKMIDEIQTAAKESLKKFFVLQKVMDELKIKADWNKPLDVERQIYQKIKADK